MPGFSLAKECLKVNKNRNIKGLALINHGIFTFGNNAKESYERMINFVSDVEKYISKNKIELKKYSNKLTFNISNLILSIRRSFSYHSQDKWIIKFHSKYDDTSIASTKNIKTLLNKGPVTPDHVIRIKSKILVINKNNFKTNHEINKYCKQYKKYFLKNKI